MNIDFYEKLYNDLKANCSGIHGNTVLKLSPTNPTYPLTIFEEIRNVTQAGSCCHQKVSNLGYRIHIYTKNKGKLDRNSIARDIAKKVNDFLQYKVGLQQISYNALDLENSGSIYHIFMVYNGTLLENRGTLI